MARVVHFDITAVNVDRAVKFYSDALGWKFEKWDGPMEYWLISTGDRNAEGIDGGLAERKGPGKGAELTIGVDSVDQAAKKIVGAGGKILREKAAIPGVGWIVGCEDTEGSTFGILESDPGAK
jgi:predicted enzyme related to lactoylglutathione lyase